MKKGGKLIQKIKKVGNIPPVKHQTYKGVSIKPIYSAEETDFKCNNLEVHIQPGGKIEPHKHDNCFELYYVTHGKGGFFINKKWNDIKLGDAMVAPQGEEHAIENTDSNEELVLFSTFVPPNVPPKVNSETSNNNESTVLKK